MPWRSLFLLCGALFACSDATPTRTLIRFSSAEDLAVPDGALLRIVGFSNGRRQHEAGERLGMFPFEEGITLPIEADDDDGTRRFTLFAELLSDTGLRLSWARIRSGFVQDERREIRIELQSGCRAPSDQEQQSLNYDPNDVCGSHDTCAAVDEEVECRSACFVPEPLVTDEEADAEPSVPVVCPAEDDIAVDRLEHGWRYGCALSGGEPFCWSQISFDSSPMFRQPSRVMTPAGRTTFTPGEDEVVDVAASIRIACMVLADGSLRCGGDNSGRALTVDVPSDGAHCCQVEPEGFPSSTEVEADNFYICTLSEEGEVWCSGFVQPFNMDDDEPVVPAARYNRRTTQDSPWTSLYGSQYHLSGLGEERLEVVTSIFATGELELPRDQLLGVFTGQGGVCVITTENELRCAGRNGAQESGPGWRKVALAHWSNTVSPQRVGDHRCGIRVDGTLWCWGDSTRGMLGVEARGDVSFEDRVQVGEESDWIDVSVGERVSCGVRQGGHVYCWGDNRARQFGADGPDTHIPQRVPVPGW